MTKRPDRLSLSPLVQEPPASLPAQRDALSDVLRMVKLTGALFFFVDASSPWSVEVPRAELFAPIILPRAQHVISYHIVTNGCGFGGVRGEHPSRFDAGDVLVFPHGDAYAISSKPGEPPQLNPENALDFFRALVAGQLPLIIPEGGGALPRAEFVCGFLGCDARPFNPLLAALPRFMHVRRADAARGDLLDRLIELSLAEAPVTRAGGECLRLRLAELMFVEVVRRYLEALPAQHTGWLSGLRDPAIGRVLSLLHERPAHPWTLEDLAREACMSRSVLADRFTQLVGLPPMQYLMQWRMQAAARLLADGSAKVSAVGFEVGYASEAAFSRAFKKMTGVSPANWRGSSAA